MMFIKFCVYFTLMSGCNKSKDTTIIGKAENAKAGAIVTSTKDQKMYYLDLVDSWHESIVGKTVKVTGTLKIEEIKPVKKDEELSQQITGIKRILLKPKWELVQ